MELRALLAGREDLRFLPPCGDEGLLAGLPPVLALLLRQSDGVMETMLHPATGERLDIQWLLYPGAMMLEETAWLRQQYGAEGTAFADDGAGNPFLCKPDGRVTLLDAVEGGETEAAPGLEAFFRGM